MKLPTALPKEFNINLKLQRNLMIFLLPISLFFVLLIATMVVITSFSRQIKEINKNLDTAMHDENILEEKLDLLRTIQGEILTRADTTLIALPDYNPSLVVLSQVGLSASDNNIRITERRVSTLPNESNDFFGSRLTIKTQGQLNDTLDFIQEIEKKNPITNLENVKINNSRTGFAGDISLAVYWASLPVKLPAITEPLKRLNTNDQELLFQLSGKDSPTFNVIEKSGPYDRSDPFNFTVDVTETPTEPAP